MYVDISQGHLDQHIGHHLSIDVVKGHFNLELSDPRGPKRNAILIRLQVTTRKAAVALVYQHLPLRCRTKLSLDVPPSTESTVTSQCPASCQQCRGHGINEVGTGMAQLLYLHTHSYINTQIWWWGAVTNCTTLGNPPKRRKHAQQHGGPPLLP